MKKIKVANKQIENLGARVFKCSYCRLQHLLQFESPIFYNAGVYGWNYDAYYFQEQNIIIVTGYRNMCGKVLDYDFCKIYDDKARELLSNWESIDAIYNLLNEFLDVLKVKY